MFGLKTRRFQITFLMDCVRRLKLRIRENSCTLSTERLLCVGSTVLLASMLAGCIDPPSLTYEPEEGVIFVATIGESEWMPEHDSTFVYVSLALTNETQSDIIFDLGQVTALLDDVPSVGTHYDSVASNLPDPRLLV